ncbi:MAG: hypothetical protein N2999_01080 [Proteobacteria bacterium]|nr:hypothetical protein [Pseudomonadota bacterium]
MAINVYKLEKGYKIYNEISREEYVFEGEFSELLPKIDKKTGINIFLPACEFSVRKAVFPKLEREKIKEILSYEMEDKFIEPSENLVMDYATLSETDKELSALVFAIEKEKIEKYIKSFGNELSCLKSISICFDETLADYLSKDSLNNKDMNFIPKEYLGLSEKYWKIEILNKIFKYFVLISIIVLVGELTRFFILKEKEKRLRSEISASSQFLSQGQKVEGDPLTYIQSKMIDLKNNYKTLKGIDSLDILKNISQHINNNIKIKEILGEGTRVSLKGECKDMNFLQQFKTNLLKNFKESKILETKNLPDGTVNFTMELEINEI